MLKNILKRTMSCLLAAAMIVTMFCAVDPSGLFPTAEAAITAQSNASPDVYIVVPETFYMTPSLTASTTVQYYVNNTVSGSTITPDEVRDATSGKIWFNASLGTVTDLEYSIIGTNKKNVSMTAGTTSAPLSDVTLQTGITASNARTLEWIFTCRINGVPAEYHAFSVAYAPYYTPVGAACNTKNGNAGTQMQGIAWISGVHSYDDCDPSPAAGTDKDNYVLGGYHARTAWDGDWNRPLVPLITDVPVPTNNDENIWDWLSDSDSGACADATFTLYDVDKSGSGWGKHSIDTATQSHIANLTVDVSRNHNFSTVPNVTTGFFVSDLKRDSKYMGSYGGYMANYAGDFPGIDFWFSRNHYGDGGGSFTATQGVDTVFFGGNTNADTGTRNFNTDGIPYNGIWNRATPTASGASMHTIHTGLCCEYDSNWIYINLYLFINVTAVNKTALRNKLFQKQYQANAKVLDNYACVRELLESASRVLGDPTSTQAAIDSAVTALDGVDGYINHTNTETISAQHIDQQTGEQMPGSAIEQLTTRRSDCTVTVSPNLYMGYTFTGMRYTYASTSAFGMFDANAWAASNCNAGGTGVTSVDYDASSRTITVNNYGSETNTAFPTSVVQESGYYYLEIDPAQSYTLDFDYASATRGRVGVICFDQNGTYAGNIWLYDSFKATGSDTQFRHHTEIICPQSNPYMFGNAKRFDIHYIVLTFGCYAEGSQSPATSVFRNVSVTPNNELFDFAEWNFRSSTLRSIQNTTGIGTKSYDSETKTLTLTSTQMDTCTSYTSDNVLSAYGIHESQTCPWNYLVVEPDTTYAIEGMYAGTGNGQITIAHYNTNGMFTEETSLSASASYGGILAGTGSDTNFDPFYATFTTKVDDGYIVLAFGGNFNPTASADVPVSNVFRDVKVHASNSADNVYTLYYQPNAFTVAFHANGGTGTMADQTLTYNLPQNLNANVFTRLGYSFDGWALTSGGEKVYADNESVTNLTAEADGVIDLYAVWTADTYTIQYDEAGGAITGDAITSYDITTSVLLPNAARDGYTLTGWRADDSGNWGPMVYNTTTPTSGKWGNVKLTAVWNANTFSVAFHANGGEGSTMANQTFVYGTSQILTANAYSRTGYTFRGWALTENADEPLYLDKERVQDLTVENNAVVTLYAVWNANPYSIVYSTDGGTIRDETYTTDYTIADPINLPVTVEKTGYAFGGWKPVSNAGSWNTETTYSGTLNVGMTGNVTLQAQWTLQGYTITYALGGGSFVSGRYTTAYDVTATIALPTARRTGYTFGGWQANGAGNWGTDVYASGNITAGRCGDVTLTAVWTGVQYYVQFNGNGATGGTMSAQVMTYGESAALNLNEYERGGYDFAGWATSDTASAATYADGESVQDLSTTAGGTVTLYAFWTKGSYTIAYDAGEGELGDGGTTTYSVTDPVTLPTATRRGYTLDGWRPQQDSGSWHTWEVYSGSIASGCYGDVTLAAQWKKATYTITYDPAGGTMSGEYTTVYDLDTQIVLPTIARAGYTFGGWQASAAWNNVILTDSAPENALGDVTLTALWGQQTYYVRFNANGGKGTMTDQLMRFDVAQALMPNAFTRDGYTFSGWAVTATGAMAYADGDTVINLSQTDGGVVDLYAVWNSCNFTIVYNLNGASGSLISTSVVMDGDAVTLRAYNVTETLIDGTPYAFKGWAYSKADADAGIAAYANRASFTLNEEVLAAAEVGGTETKPTITLYAVWTDVEIKLIPAEGSTTIIDVDRHFIYGLRTGVTRAQLAEEYLAVSGNGTIVISSGPVGTGTVVTLVSNFTNEPLETYEIIIFGDLNGDGLQNTTDVAKMRQINVGLLEGTFNDAFMFAADLYDDGNINTTDIGIMREIATGLREYDQVTRTVA